MPQKNIYNNSNVICYFLFMWSWKWIFLIDEWLLWRHRFFLTYSSKFVIATCIKLEKGERVWKIPCGRFLLGQPRNNVYSFCYIYVDRYKDFFLMWQEAIEGFCVVSHYLTLPMLLLWEYRGVKARAVTVDRRSL